MATYSVSQSDGTRPNETISEEIIFSIQVVENTTPIDIVFLKTSALLILLTDSTQPSDSSTNELTEEIINNILLKDNTQPSDIIVVKIYNVKISILDSTQPNEILNTFDWDIIDSSQPNDSAQVFLGPLVIAPTTAPLSTSLYIVEVRDYYGRLVAVIERPMQKQFTIYRNKPGYCQFTIDANDPQSTDAIFKDAIYDIVFKRLGTIVFCGQISYIEPKVDTSDNLTNVITATGHFDLLDQRMIGSSYPGYDTINNQLSFTGIDGGSVIQTLLGYTQFPLLYDGLTVMSGTTPTICQSFNCTGNAYLKTIKLLLQNYLVYSGTATSATTNTLTDTHQSWTVNAFIGATVQITGGTDNGEILVIASNTSNTITLYSASGIGTATSATLNTLTDTSQSWITNAFAGKVLSITTGTDNGDAATIVSNTSNTLTISGNFLTTPDNTSQYSITPISSGTWTTIPDTTSTYIITPTTALTSGNLIIGIYNDLGGAPSSLVANSQLTIPVSTIGLLLNWNTFTYSTLPSLSLGQTYWIKCYLDTPVSVSGSGIMWAYTENDMYPSGKAYSPENPSLFNSNTDMQFFVQLTDNSWQMTVNTYIGLQPGLTQTSFNITRSDPQFKKVKNIIEEISGMSSNGGSVSGIDFNITYTMDSNNNMTKYFNIYYPRQGIDNTALNFTYPGNVIKIDKPKDAKSVFNKIYTRGQGSGANQPITTSISGESIQNYGLHEETVDYSDVPDTSTLQGIGDETLRVSKDPLDTPTLTIDGKQKPPITSYGLGDTILIKSQGNGVLGFTAEYRIEEIDATISDEDEEFYDLVVSHA